MPPTVKDLFKRATRAFGVEVRRYRPEYSSDCVSLRADGIPTGTVLIAYILEPFRRRPDEPVSTRHTHHRESILMVETWLNQGFCVDVIDYRNQEFIPRKHYDFFVSARTHLEKIASRLNSDCVKVAHLDTSHYAFNNHASYGRLRAVQERRGVSLRESMRLVEPNRAIECADFGVVLGNEVTAATYHYAGTHLFQLEVPAAIECPFNSGKDCESSRKHFLWLGSGGLVHKGLDIVLEAFGRMPDMHLTVCGPVSSEKAFEEVYTKELYQTPNIHMVGWVDIAGREFRRIAGSCLGIIYPSCAEGQAGAVVTCLRAGLIPVVSRESGITVGDFGTTLRECTVEGIQRTVYQISSLSTEELARRTRKTWEYARNRHSHKAYAERYEKIVQAIVAATKN